MNSIKPLLIGILLMFSFTNMVSANNLKADSLNLLIKQSNSELETAKLNLELSWVVKYENLEDARQIANDAFVIVTKLDDLDGIAIYHSYVGVFDYLEKNIPSAIKNLKLAEGIFRSQNNFPRLGRVYNNLGNAYGYLGDNESALSYYKKGLEIKEQFNEHVDISANLINIGTVYYDQGDYQKCIETNEKALILTLQNNDYESIATIYSNLGATYERLGDYKKSVNYTLKALDIYHNNIKNQNAEVRIYSNLGSSYLFQGLTDEARYYFLQAREINQEVNSEPQEVVIMNNLSELERISFNYDIARKNAKQALALAIKIHDTNEEMVALQELYLIENDVKNFELALTYYIDYISLSDSVIANSNIQKTEIALAQNQLILDKLEEQKEEERNILRESKITILNMLLILSGVLFAIWLLLFLRTNRGPNVFISILNFTISILILASVNLYLFLKTDIISTLGVNVFFLIVLLIVVLGAIMHQIMQHLSVKTSK